jgi:uncharacterized protein DUF6011
MSFNPANFPFTMPKLQAEPEANPVLALAEDLHAAACRYEARTDDFAAGKGATCRDIAEKLTRFGSFASEKQRDFALKLIEWSKPRQAAQAPAAARNLPRLFALMQRLSKLTIGPISLARRNGDTMCWVKHEGAEKVVGRLTDGGALTLWQRNGIDMAALSVALAAIEKDPEAAAVLHGRASGRCSICNRDLTDPESIARGIGPICAEKF